MIIKDMFQLGGMQPAGAPKPESNAMMYGILFICCMCICYSSSFGFAYSQGWIFAKSEGGETSVGLADCPTGKKQVCNCVNDTSSGNSGDSSTSTNESFENETDDDDE
jgi:hypothetical protein